MKYLYSLLAIFACINLNAQNLQPATYSTNGTIYDMDHDANNLYIGGSFSEIGFSSNYFTNFPIGEDRPEFDILQPNSIVDITIPDGNGGWYIGGSFSQISGQSALRIAHILNNNTLDANFDLTLNNSVTSLFLIGNDLYIGGNFSNANSISVNRLIRVNKNTGALDNSWLPGILNGSVESIYVSDDIVHVGGSFVNISGSGEQQYYAQFDINTALPNTSFSVNSSVSDMVADGNNLYLSGSFSQAGSYKRYLLSFNEANIFPDQEFPDANSTIDVIEPDGNGGYYVGGSFSQLGDQAQSRLSHILADGTIDPDFSITLNSSVYAISLDGANDLYIGGAFTQVNGTSSNYIARLNRNTGALDNTWQPSLNSHVYAIAITGSTVHLGGAFYEVNGSSNIQYYAELDKTTAETIQTPSPNSYIQTFAKDGNNLYMGGSFSSTGYYQPYLEMFSIDNSIPQFQFPTANSTINNSIPDGNGGWYVSGSFSTIGGVSALRVAHILADNSVDPNFVCNTNSSVNALHLDGNNLYLGGSFTTINGATATRIARVNKTTGELDDSWSANPNSVVYAVRTTDDKVVIGGGFTEINSNTGTRYFAALDKTTGELFQTPAPNSTVHSIEMQGNEAYIGGSFSAIEFLSQYMVRFPEGSNIPVFGDATPNNNVEEIISDGNGGYYVSGSFTNFNGVTSNRVAHYLSDGTLDPNFTPASINSTVETMGLSGSDLYIGGSFSTINGISIQRLAKLNATTGAADETFAPNPNSTVYTLKVVNGLIYFGGSFDQVDGTSRLYLGAVNSGGVLQAWNPNPNSYVYSLEADGSTIYAGGIFSSIGGLAANRLAGINATTGALTSFNPSINSSVNDLLLSGSTLYIGGSFTQVDGASRNRFASMNVNTGALNALTININGTVESLALNGSGIIAIGGSFTQVNGEDRLRFAEITIATGNLNDREINFNSTVNAVYYQGSDLIVGGNFTTINSIGSQRIAVYNTDDLLAYPTDFGAINSTVHDMVISNGVLYFSGSFTSVNSTARQRIAAFNISDGSLTSLNPTINSTVNTLAINGNNLYFGGSFDLVNSQTRQRAAALDINTGVLTDWDPALNSTVETISIDGDDVLVGGSFSYSHSKNIYYLAVRDFDTPEFNQVTSTNINSTINKLLINGSTLYAGGSFSSFDGQPRSRFAAFDLNANAVTDLILNANSTVNAIDIFDDKLFVGGSFTQIAGENRSRVAIYNLSTDVLEDFNPGLNSTVNDIAANAERILIGGSFSVSNELSSSYVMSVDLTTGLPNIFFTGINSTVNAIAIQGDNLYLGGYFTSVGGESRPRFASINKATGALNPLSLNFNNIINDFEISGDNLYAVGSFVTVDGSPRLRGASINLTDGSLNDFNPGFNSTAYSLSSDGTSLSFSGAFTRTQTLDRQNFAAISLATNEPISDFAHNVNSTVLAVKANGDAVYIGGYFSQVAGQNRNRLASFSSTTGSLNTFDLQISGSYVEEIETSGDNVYFSGSFTTVSGTARAGFAGWNTAGNSLLTLDIPHNGSIEAIEIADGIIYLGGSFNQLMGTTRNRIGAVDLSTGSLTSFDPSANSTVTSIEVDGNLLYAGGHFSTIGGQTRQRIAALSISDGSANSWAPVLNGNVEDFEIAENYLFATGSFTLLDGNTANRLVLLDKNSGDNIFDFAPSLNSTGHSVKYIGETLYVGGQYTTIGQNYAHPYFSQFNVPPPGTSTFSASMESTTDINGFDIACNGASTGELEITVSGGTAPYSYTLTNTASINRSGNIAGSTATESNLPAGNYTLNVEDSEGGIAVANLSLTQPSPFSVSSTITTPVLTVDGNEASVTLSITGGVAPFDYSYTIDGGDETTGSSAANSILIENLGAGNYNFEITDANGCVANTSKQINNYVLATVALTLWDNITCNGDNDGRLRIQVTNGLAPYSYTLDSDDDTYDRAGVISSQNSASIESDLGPGTYTVTITDITGAIYNAGPYTLTEPDLLSASIAVAQNPSAPGENDGSFTVSISGGVANYSMLIYKNDAASFYQTATSTTATVINQGAGFYYIVLTDANGCQITTNTIELVAGVDPCIALGGDSDNDGICDDLDPCPFLADLENGDNCGINGTVVNCECVEDCNLTLGNPTVTCLGNTEGDDSYTVSITYTGSAPGATISTGVGPDCTNGSITVSGDDPATNVNGTIMLTANEADGCWSISIQSALCDIVLSGDAPSCNPGVDCPDLGLNNGDPCGNGGTVVDCQCLFPDCNGDLGGSVVDADNDGVCDDIDNCIGLANSNQNDLDNDGLGDACDPDIDGDGIANANDCDPLDENIGLATNWYIDNDDDGYGTGDAPISSCSQPDGYAPVSGDCNDNDPDVNPGAQTLTFLGTAGFENAFMSPLQGSPNTTFNFAIVYTDATGAIPPIGFPRVLLDFEGNAQFNNANDRAILLSPSDQNDMNTTDGKVYVGSINELPSGSNWEARIQVQTSGCITQIGPFDYPDVLTEPDLEIFADDIVFDNPNPDVSSPLQISATVRNTSDLPAENFVMHLVNQFEPGTVFPDITVGYLAPHSSTTVSWNIITSAEPSWNPMEVYVDYTNVIVESNELDNRAMRPFTNGNYFVPGAIVIYPVVSPAVQYAGPNAAINVSGYAYYTDTAVPLQDSSVAGATVSISNPMTGGTVVGNTNSHGYFSVTLNGGNTPGNYSATGEITDYTLTGQFTVNWELLTPPCLPDLRTTVTLSESQIFVGESIDGSITVTNIGCAPVEIETLLDATQTGGIPIIGDVTVPPLDPGESFTYNFSDIQFNTIGVFTICGYADAEFLVAESNENNNLGCKNLKVVPPLPDITPIAGPIGTYYFCSNLPFPAFVIRNIGYVPTGTFDYTVDVFHEGAISQSYTQTIENLNAGQSATVSVPYAYQNLGAYTFTITCDIPMPEGIVAEISETNNIGNYGINIIPCKPDLTVLSCNQLDVDPADLEIPGTATYTARVRNNGNATATGPIDFEFTVSNGEVYALQYANDIAPGEVVVMTTEAPSVTSGTATLTAFVDPDNLIEEFSENNNSVTDSLCWEYAAVPKCGYNFWNTTYYQNQSAYISVGLQAKFLYKASQVKVRFEVSGPGITGTALLGDATVQNVEQNCNCPYVAALPTSFIFNEIGTYTFTMTADPDNEYPECNEGNNVLVRQVQVTSFPDMRILSEFINPTLLNPEPGQSVFFDISYENIGVSNIDDEMNLTVLVDEIPFSVIENVPGLITGQNTTIAIPIPYSSDLAGAHIIRAIIDSDNEIQELNELNNEATRALIVGSAANLFFEVFLPTDPSPVIGQGINIDATIGNNGDIDVSAEVLFSYISNAGDTIQIGSIPVSVANGGSQDISLPWTVIDNNTKLLGEIVNATEIEFNYEDNFASANLSNFDVVISSEPSCAGQNLGSLTANANNGVAPYTYSWSNGFVGATLEAPAGTYSVTVTDGEGQEANATATIAENPDCIEEICDISAVSFNIPNCNPETGVYNTTLVVAYQYPPDVGFITVNGTDYAITGSPQSFSVPFTSGAVIYNVSFTESTDCSLTILTGTTLEECQTDCEGIFGGNATPGSSCETQDGASGIYDDDCNCVPTATASLLTLECGGQVIQITGALAGNNGGGNATADTRTVYAFMPDNGNGTPNYSGTVWPYVIIEGNLEADGNIGATLSTNANGVLLINGWPAYQFSGDVSSTDVGGTFGPWNYFLPDGTLSQDACEVEYDCPDVSQNFGDACDDGDPLTENDIRQDDCSCAGTPIETFDCPDVSQNFGDACDDGDPLTENDIRQDDCSCAGTPIETFDCPDVSQNFGDACDDGDPLTENDIRQDDCSCAGTPIETFDCPDVSQNFGDACDDGDPLTENDIRQEDCSCAGTPIETFDCPDVSQNFGDACDDGDPLTENDIRQDDCSCAGTPIETFDCPDVSQNFGDACDDGDPLTENDIRQDDCSCAGTPIVTPVCDNFVYFLSDHSAADGISDIYKVTLNGANADLDYIATSDIEVHIAYNPMDNLIYAVSKHTNSYRTLDPYAAVPTFGPTVDLGADYGELTAAVFNAEGKLLFGSQNNNAIYCVNVTTNVVTTYDTYAPVTGGDLAFRSDGMLYLATRTGNGLYEVWPSEVMPDQFIGSVPNNVTGLAITDTDQLLVSSRDNSNLVVRNSNDGSDAGSYALMLNGESYTLRDGDMASGCDTHQNVIDDCGYKLYYIHTPAGGGNQPLLEVTLNNDGTASYNSIIPNIGGHIGLSPDGSTIYNVSAFVGNSSLKVIDVATASVINTVNIHTAGGENLDGFPACVVGSDGTLYVGSRIKNRVYTVDPVSGIATPYGPSRTVQGGDLVEVDGEIWIIRRDNNSFTNVMTGASFTVPVTEINGAAVLSNGNVLVADGNGGSLLKEIDLSTQLVVGTYDIGLPLLDGDLAGGCTQTNPLIEGCYGIEVVDFFQGPQTNGGNVATDRSNAAKALGEPDRNNAPGGFVSLGVGGHITIAFAGAIGDAPGNDIKIYETSFSGNVCGGSDDESADIELSADGSNFVSIGSICRDGEVDIADAGLDYVTAIRITNSASTASLDGYDVDGVEAIYGCSSIPSIDPYDDGVDAADAQSQLTSYPNPTTGASDVIFTPAKTGTTLVEVYDMNGRNVATLFNEVANAKQEYRLNFNGNNLPNGVYIYRMTTNNETIIDKFMIAK